MRLRIEALRREHAGRMFENAGCLRTNCMRYLPHYFAKGQLDKVRLFTPYTICHIPYTIHHTPI
ncbi:hypothetical protein EON63_14240 [archaeon]|nr:MAG: hypothetical protein EON63_14240 [archaeon]